MDVHPLTPAVGAEVHGVDVRALDACDIAVLRAHLVRFGVLVLRPEPPLDRVEHDRLARCFGDPEQHAAGEADVPSVVRIRHGVDAPPTENVWHCDMSFRAAPPMGAVLRAVEVPATGGDTLFADMRAVWRRIPEEIRDVLRPLRARHDIAKWLIGPAAADLRERWPPVDHPVVVAHPETGEELLFVDEGYTTAVVGMDPGDSATVLAYVQRHVTHPEVQCRIRWQPGMVAVWDNRSTQHFACADYLPAERVMERIALRGTGRHGRGGEI